MTRRALAALGVLALVALLGAPAAAQPSPPRPAGPSAAPAPARRERVVLAPLATLGAESSSAAVRATQKLVARGLLALGSVDLISQTAMLEAVRRARRPELRGCDGEAECLSSLAQLVAADYAVYGEVGGLGSAHVVYLKLVDARERREVRSTVLELTGAAGQPTAGDAAEAESLAAATRLLAPQRYIGRVQVDTPVRGASIFVDGVLVARSPARPLLLAVGSHALRVTHPEFRDFVRFVEVEFGATERIAVDLRPYREVAGDIRRTQPRRPVPVPTEPGAAAGEEPTPWYRRWYTIAGGGVLLLVGSAVVVGLVTDGFDFDTARDL